MDRFTAGCLSATSELWRQDAHTEDAVTIDVDRNMRLGRAVFLSALLVHFRAQRRRNRSEPRIPGCS
jgi:hypothetical protein